MIITNCPRCGSMNITTAGVCTNCGWSQFTKSTVSTCVSKTIGEIELKVSGKALLDDYKRLLLENRNLKERIAELEEQARALKARKATTERANDTRRTVVLGSLVLQEIDKDTAASKALRSWLSKELPEKLTRDRDREIFAELLTKISRSDDA